MGRWLFSLLVGVPLACFAAGIDLTGNWTLDYWPQPESGAVRTLEIPAHKTVASTVPGNCELDLVRAGVLPQPELGLNAQDFRKYEGYQWLYTRTFEVAADQIRNGKVYLVFEGIDTLADIFLNGEKIGEAENMFVEHRFEVTGRLATGENKVQVLLRSVFLDSRTKTLGELGHTMAGGAEGEPYRKAGHMGGWDIFPRLFVSGLWRGVRLELHDAVEIDQTSWIVKSLDLSVRKVSLVGSCRIRMPFEAIGKCRFVAKIERGGKTVTRRELPANHFHQSFSLNVENADIWWPRGFGDPALYDASIEILDDEGRSLARHAERIGLRTVELVRDDVYGPDRPGQFLFKVNGMPIYIRGSNWVPVDAMHGRDSQHMMSTLELFKDLNCNMFRVWGGGVYEP
ncbi:MAG: glycoside hydrolase family 2, partial [bacterium]|nr:glycoside hydrolase family 2 [Candidatus Colisoma equi]